MPSSKNQKKVIRQPQQSRSKFTVSTILDAGARILAIEGWKGFNTNAIAARAGVSIGSVYEYFKDKQSLVDAIAIEHLSNGEELLKNVSVLKNSSLSTNDLIELIVSGVIAIHEDDPKLHKALSSQTPLSSLVQKRAQDLRSGFITLVQDLLVNKVVSPHVSAQILVDVTDAIIHRWWIEDDGKLSDPKQLASELKLMLRAYLATKEANAMNSVANQ